MKTKNSTLKRVFECFFSGVVIAILLILVLWFINFFNVFTLPEYITRFFESGNDEPDTSYYDESSFYDFLEQNSHSATDIAYVTLNEDNVEELVYELIERDVYFWEVETELFYKQESTVSNHKVWKNGNSVRVDTLSSGVNNSVVITDTETVIRDNLTGDERKIIGDTDFAPESIINIADITFYLNSDITAVTDARLIETESEKYLFVKFYTKELDKVDEFYLSLDYGVILSAASELEGEIIFHQKTINFVPDTAVSRDIFLVD